MKNVLYLFSFLYYFVQYRIVVIVNFHYLIRRDELLTFYLHAE